MKSLQNQSWRYEFKAIYYLYRLYNVRILLRKVLQFCFQSVLEGYNGTIMAYGQTGTGKTFTLGRLGEEDTAARGIMVRAMEDILADVSLETDSVSVSYFQVLCCFIIHNLFDSIFSRLFNIKRNIAFLCIGTVLVMITPVQVKPSKDCCIFFLFVDFLISFNFPLLCGSFLLFCSL